MKHLEIEQLKKYGTRRLNADEMTAAILHLDECGACFDAFQTMFPALCDAAREISVADLTANEAEVFHLDYDEHLRPLVDGEADAATREIVESHSANCAFCACAVRELREFSDGLRLREIGKSADETDYSGAAVNRRRGLKSGTFGRVFLPTIAVLILGIGGWLIWRQPAAPIFISESQTLKTASLNSANENSFSRIPANPFENRAVNSKSRQIENHSANINKKIGDGKKRELPLTGNELSLAALPPDFRARFQNALRTGRINLPAFIADLRGKSNLRGEPANEKNAIISPNAQAERSLRPVFRWRKFAAEESYVVTIYDNNFNQIAVSPKLKNAKWRSNVPLERGKIYQWQVKAETAESHAAQFKILDENAIARLNEIENATTHSPRARGIGYASEGLLDEAAREFQKEIENNPRDGLAKKLKNSMLKRE